MGLRLRNKMGGGAVQITTAAGLARRVKRHRGTVTRALRRIPGAMKTRVGHQFMLSRRMQAQVRRILR